MKINLSKIEIRPAEYMIFEYDNDNEIIIKDDDYKIGGYIEIVTETKLLGVAVTGSEEISIYKLPDYLIQKCQDLFVEIEHYIKANIK